MKILISLVSDQTIPNVLFIKEHSQCDAYLFISTQRMEAKGRTADIIRAAGINGKNCTTLIVDENSPKLISAALHAMKINDDDAFLVNLTCGTKIMTLTVHDFFSKIYSEINPVLNDFYSCSPIL